MALGIKPTVDFVFKKVFGSPENVAVLIELLNAILRLRYPIVQVEILNPFSYQEFVSDKQIVLDVRARDSTGRLLNIEMQVTVTTGLLQRLMYYTCSLYVDQIEAGQDYTLLRPAISICLLNRVLFAHSCGAHHRFRLADVEHGLELSDTIEIHTVELTKYNVSEATIAQATPIDQWVFFFLYADRYEPDRLRALLPGIGFQQAISVVEVIAAKTEDRTMYDQRAKAQRDYQWGLNGARAEGREEGLVEGHELGLVEGHEKGLVEGHEKGLVEGHEKGLVEGREEGREEGWLAGKIQTLQELLGDAPSSKESLLKQSVADLTAQLAGLQDRLRTRSS